MVNYCFPAFKSGVVAGMFISLFVYVIVILFEKEIGEMIRRVVG